MSAAASAEPEHTLTVAVDAAAAPALKPKNAHRLQRLSRKAEGIPPRAWREGLEGWRPAGVPPGAVRALVEGLSEEEVARALAGQPPLSVLQQELARRASRFGLVAPPGAAAPAAALQTPASTFVVDAETLRSRQARFGVLEQPLTAAAAAAPPLTVVSEEQRALLEARARRFAPA